MSVNFALIGAGGFIAPRHLQAIHETGNRLVAALDPNDSVGVLDRYFLDVPFFTEFERFDRFAEKLRRGDPAERIHWVSVCSPNYLHDAHIRFALRIGADAICEKPLVLNPWNLDALAALEAESGRRIRNVLQLRLHPAIQALKTRIDAAGSDVVHDVDLTYLTARGRWYHVSWKGDPSKSGGVVMNIGVHFFDMLQWIFGGVRDVHVAYQDHQRSAGHLELERARVRWFLSLDPLDVGGARRSADSMCFRSLTVDGEVVEFSDGFAGLHTAVYRQILDGGGFGIEDSRPSVELAHRIRHAVPASADPAALGPFRVAPGQPRTVAAVADATATMSANAEGPSTAHAGSVRPVVHPTAIVDQGATIGEGTKVWHFSHVLAGTVIGRDCTLGQNVMAGPDVRIGDRCKIQNNVSLYNGVELEDCVFCGPSMVFTNIPNPRCEFPRKGSAHNLRTLVRYGASIGANATLVCGITVGRFAFVAAGAVVVRDVADYALMAGVPARRVGWMSRHGARLPEPDLDGVRWCPLSGWRYREHPGDILRCLDWPEDKPVEPSLHSDGTSPCQISEVHGSWSSAAPVSSGPMSSMTFWSMTSLRSSCTTTFAAGPGTTWSQP